MEDGWVATDTPVAKEGIQGKNPDEAMDIDDMDMENIEANQ